MIGRLFCLMVIGVLLFAVDGLGQNTWVKTFGGSGYEHGNSIANTRDGGFVLTGISNSADGDFSNMIKYNSPIYILKINSIGNIVWNKIIGGSYGECGLSIKQTSDGGYILTGETGSNDGDFSGLNKSQYGKYDIFVIKLDSMGVVQWKKTYGGFDDDKGYSISQTNDGGYVLTGWTESDEGEFRDKWNYSVDAFVMRINHLGDVIWTKIFGGFDVEIGYSIINSVDGGYVISGFAQGYSKDLGEKKIGNSSDGDVFVLKLNYSGEVVWKNRYGGNNYESGNDIVQTVDGGYVVTGYTSSDIGDFEGEMNNVDIFIFKIDSKGFLLWTKTFREKYVEEGFSIKLTSDGGYVLTGKEYGNFDKGTDIIVMKLNSNGGVIWKKTFGGIGDDWGRSITTTSDGGFVLTGFTNSIDGQFNGLNRGQEDIFVMKLDSNGNFNNTTSINEFSEPTTTLSVHPNPFSNSTTISYKVNTPSNFRIELLNTLGQTIEVLREDYTDIGTYKLPLNVSTLSSGMYSVRMRSGSMNEVVPVWVVR